MIERKKILNGATSLSVREIREQIAQHRLDAGKTKKRRSHRKTPGMIGFKDLTSKIAARWRAIDGSTRHVLDQLAKAEQQHYRKQLKEWKALQKKEKKMHPQDDIQERQSIDGQDDQGGHLAQEKKQSGCSSDDNYGRLERVTDRLPTMTASRTSCCANTATAADSWIVLMDQDDWSKSSIVIDSLFQGVDILKPMDTETMDLIFSD
eukprot:CAMPEP_0198148240 /NCGR_PEP_ID=MMETSP1443-20131203/40560_1 /TAXON_ID=186043 /ORGANISM="Entomoneis sp., Strain CCMP2396" /LENGTH=206 /DNA_ID=CAMNT_0043812881 /DNA_START=1 /DNA_END=621 /DNA_ORIENTATION=+